MSISNNILTFQIQCNKNKEINKMNRQLLEQPFDQKFIKQRKGNFGQMLDYLETHIVIQRLNDVFESNWNFEIVSHELHDGEVVVLGKLTAEGISKMQFGSNKITVSKQGDVISIGDDFKSAASDSLKKCATLLGVGLHLYGELVPSESEIESEATTKPKTDMGNMTGNLGNNLITKDQLAQIKKLRTEHKLTPEDIQSKCKRLFGTTEVTSLNATMATALIVHLQNNGGNGHK
jgi:hypothetical protein